MHTRMENAHRGIALPLAWVATLVAFVLGAGACRSLAPVPLDAQARGTVAGTVRGPEGVAPVADRLVELVEIESGRRESTKTNDVGDYSILVPPGRYRVEVALGPGEVVVSDPGLVDVAPSQLVAHVDVVLGGAGVVEPE